MKGEAEKRGRKVKVEWNWIYSQLFHVVSLSLKEYNLNISFAEFKK